MLGALAWLRIYCEPQAKRARTGRLDITFHRAAPRRSGVQPAWASNRSSTTLPRACPAALTVIEPLS